VLNLLPFRCDVRAYANAQAMTTWATGYAVTNEPPTTIFITFYLETWNPTDQRWVSSNWTDRRSAMSVQSFSVSTFPQGCTHGLYRWKVDVSFASQPNMTYWDVSDSVAI
jgi:hypothetical protein